MLKICLNLIFFSFFFCQKPEDWLDDEPEYVPDPNVVQPDDWNEEEDGEWDVPQVGELI